MKKIIKFGMSDKDLDIFESLGLLKDTISNLIEEREGYDNLSFSKNDVRKLLFDLQTLREENK